MNHETPHRPDGSRHHNDHMRTEKNNSLFIIVASILAIALIIGYVMRNKAEDTRIDNVDPNVMQNSDRVINDNTPPAVNTTSDTPAFIAPDSGKDAQVINPENETVPDTTVITDPAGGSTVIETSPTTEDENVNPSVTP